MWSERFGRNIMVTQHASSRMRQRLIAAEELQTVLDKGTVRYKDEKRLWIAISFPDRADNMICAAVVLEGSLVVKTVMHYFSWEGES